MSTVSEFGITENEVERWCDEIAEEIAYYLEELDADENPNIAVFLDFEPTCIRWSSSDDGGTGLLSGTACLSNEELDRLTNGEFWSSDILTGNQT